MKHSHTHIFMSCCLLAGLVYLSADIFLPSIVTMAKHFGSDVHIMQQGTAILMMGLAISQLIFGPISESVGRKKVILWGLSISSIGCVMSLLSFPLKNLPLFLFGELVQGLGLGATALFRAILRDSFEGKELLQKGNFVSIFNSLLAPGATMIGGFIEVHFGSTHVFTFLLLSMILGNVYTYIYLPETYEEQNMEKLNPRYIFEVYKLVLQHKIFRGYCLCTMATYLSYFAWVITLPVYAIKFLHWSPDGLGNIMLITSASAMVSGGFANKFLVARFETSSVMQFGWSLMLLSSISMFLHDTFLQTNATMSFSMMMLFQFATCFLWSNYFIKAFEPFNESAGYASALYAASQISGSMLAAFIAGFLPEHNLTPLSVLLMSTTLITWVFHAKVIEPSAITVEDLLDEAEREPTPS